MQAFGLCLNYTSWIVAISDNFHKKHALVFSLSQSGVGLGIFVFGPLFSYLIGVFGWRGAILITGACTFQLTCLGALIFPPRKGPISQQKLNTENVLLTSEEKNIDAKRKSKLTGSEVDIQISRYSLKWSVYCGWMLHLSSFFWLLATSIPYILLADYTRSLDLEQYVPFTNN